ncbi:hypothetical protein LEP1GSC179_0046 [Leptospira santarosai str. MOR084]|uniref:Uncharacterized protein n=1 Tax=Leptospira santarosai str. MOR084 TaxID=1049984 RepID=A0A0E2BQE2_9LEPT|nr:hypothetical protein LEP1GSC179_0046 [Leptospira santarosai str. MOR084]
MSNGSTQKFAVETITSYESFDKALVLSETILSMSFEFP